MKMRTLLFVTSYPPRECGIATFAQDLINAMNKNFAGNLNIEVAALEESGKPNSTVLQAPVNYRVNPFDIDSCIEFAQQINENEKIDLVCFEHEFGLYGGDFGHNMLAMISLLDKPFVVRFHTVLPYPDLKCKKVVSLISALASKVIVMTRSSAKLLEEIYQVPTGKIVHIPHGTHAHIVDDMSALKKQYNVEGRFVLSTFGLLSENKGIEVGIKAMRDIAREYPNALYLVLGKTHPVVHSREGEKYRESLEALVKEYGLENNVRFINSYLSLKTLLDYLALTDIYLFSSKDPHQAVSGTFVYAMSAGCAVISTSFVQAREMLEDGAGILVDFNSPEQMSAAALQLLGDQQLRKSMSNAAIEKTRSSIWENVAIAHMSVISEALVEDRIIPNLPPPYLDHVDRLTDEFGMLQFSNHDVPDPSFGYTLDDNARALIAMCMYSGELKPNTFVNTLMRKYAQFINYCQRPSGKFLNYVDNQGEFDDMNDEVNLEDANGRAVWAMGYVLKMHETLPFDVVQVAMTGLRRSFGWMNDLRSPRAIAFTIKGLYYALSYRMGEKAYELLTLLAEKLYNYYLGESDESWHWYESCLTYGNAVMPEAMMMAYKVTGRAEYKHIAEESLAFLCDKTFTDSYMKLISNKTWYHRTNGECNQEDGGEQSIEVAYTMLALNTFYNITKNNSYLDKMRLAFSWYLGNNHLKQLVYNPLTYGCYDGLEKNSINQNQGAESTVCYLIARLLMEQWNKHKYVTAKQTSLEPAKISSN